MTTAIFGILILLAIILSLSGIVGAIVPAIPGPPLSFASLLTVYFTCPGTISTELLIWMLVATLIVSVLDYVAPIFFTKIGGGSKRAVLYSTIGMIIGLFYMPLGLIVGPLIGAFIGEMSESNDTSKATKAALMSFLAFLLTTGLKLIASAVMTFYTFAAIFDKATSYIPDFSVF
ncbi:MAG: DUF456 domain-containing protein [Bacteroidales bacterium]|nr:DUF456 domain-containing protein [Bacteroidales bacterium]